MSTFNGIISEIKGISIDRFDKENLNSTLYFLSHIHSDHMVGFSNLTFLTRLQEEDVFLYGSQLTAQMLKEWYPEYKDKFLYLPMGTASFLKIPRSNKMLAVNAIPAGHCPGSIMFLFEIDDIRVLYTGDFRLEATDLHKYKSFYNEYGELKHLNKIYLDTTFLFTKYNQFPKRDESMKVMIERIDEWIKISKDNLIQIERPAKYGFEFIFIEISKHFKKPIHVPEEIYNIYRYIPEMDKAITLNEDTQIHSCWWNDRSCDHVTTLMKTVRWIKPTAMYWDETKMKDNKISDGFGHFFRICYSSHSSYQELVEFLKFFKADAIAANVVPKNADDRKLMCKEIQNIVKSYTICDNNTVSTKEKMCFQLLDTEYDKSSDDEVDLTVPVKRTKL